METSPLVKMVNVQKEYRTGDISTFALRRINLEIRKHDFRLILGPSGCGKTTLLNILGGISNATSGEVLIQTSQGLRNVASLNARELTNYRRYTVGIIFQFYNLIPLLTALENVELAARLAQIKDSEQKSHEYLKMVGLEDKADRFPVQLSGGEQQRIAIARALIKNPALILADEPTGNLDSQRGREIYQIFEEITHKFDTAILVVTHDTAIAETYGKNHIHIRDGQLLPEE